MMVQHVFDTQALHAPNDKWNNALSLDFFLNYVHEQV
jgi:hypothetical protein